MELIQIPQVQQAMPLIYQLEPLSREIAAGRTDFNPQPPQTRELITRYYRVPRNLLVGFANDTIDETAQLTDLLQVVGKEKEREREKKNTRTCYVDVF